MKLLVPAYIYPGAPPRTEWSTWIGAAHAFGWLIADPGTPGGPGTFTDTNYQAVIAAAQAQGIGIFGYVDTNFARPDASTPVLDNFNSGALGNVKSRSGWSANFIFNSTTYVTDATPTKAALGASQGSNVYGSSAADCECYLTMVTWTPSTDVFSLATRITAVGGATPTYYALRLANGSTTDFQIIKVVAGVTTVIGALVSQLVSNGDSIGIRAVGTRITSFYKPAAGAWAQMDSVIDSSISGSGFIGGFRNHNAIANEVDNFGGGAVGSVIDGQVDGWKTWYGINDIFFDNVSSSNVDIAYYTTLTNYVRSTHGGAKTMLNHGTNSDIDYAAISDIQCTFEGVKTTYDSYLPSSWMLGYPADRFCHLIYAIANQTDMQSVLDQARRQNAGLIYATDDATSWFVFPTFFAAEVTKLDQINAPRRVATWSSPAAVGRR